MSIKASEISDLIGQRIQNFAGATEARNVGSVVSVADGVVRIALCAGLAVGCGDHVVTVCTQRRAQQVQNIRVIIDDEKLHWSHPVQEGPGDGLNVAPSDGSLISGIDPS